MSENPWQFQTLDVLMVGAEPAQVTACVSARMRLPRPLLSPAHAPMRAQVDPAGSNITLAVGCGYDCSRIYAGSTLQAYNGSTNFLGAVGVLANNVVPNPLAPGTRSTTFPNANLAASVYVNVTVACWPASFSVLVCWGPFYPRHDMPRCRWQSGVAGVSLPPCCSRNCP